ncbi:MAG: precorrin-2 dehydrogenase/sirohydrochlorin ferrochelatase family protein [Actinomycetota bacterium]
MIPSHRSISPPCPSSTRRPGGSTRLRTGSRPRRHRRCSTGVCARSARGSQVRAAIAGMARARGALVNIVDDVPNCDIAMPALVRRGDLTLAVGTGGRSPALARRSRERLEDEFGPEWTEASLVLGEVRQETLPSLPDLRDRALRWRRALDIDEAASLVRDGKAAELRDRLRSRLLAEEAS